MTSRLRTMWSETVQHPDSIQTDILTTTESMFVTVQV